MEKPSSAKSKRGSSPGSPSRRAISPPKSAGKKKTTKKSSPSPSRKGKPSSPSRKSPGGELKSAMRKGSGKDKTKKKTATVKSPDLTDDGLKIIDMSGQGMTILPLSVVSTKDLGELVLASNNLRSLPIEIKRLNLLTKLDISKNGIRCTNPGDFSGLPLELSLLVTLQELKISECNLPYVPPAIWKMTFLKSLDISRNKINILVADIGELRNLQKLNLQQTNITTLPPEIAYCQELEEILMWGNVIESLPETLPEMLKLRTLAVNYRSFCAQVDSFHESEELLRKGKLTSEHIPMVVFELGTLEVLDLENTKINNVPDMSNYALKELYLCKNFLSKVPPSLFNLNHVTILDLSNNLLSLLPDNISRITSLTILRLSNNQIERIPNKIRELSNLEELNFADNKIHYIPSTIGGLKKLKALFIENNDLTTLPDEICELENLETLDITQNRISALPMKMHMLKNLGAAHSYQKLSKYGLWLYKNPIVQPPPEIWKTERPEKIFEYLKKLAIIKTENLQRQKMLVFGETGSGKTSLINGLVHRKSMMTNGEEDKTRALTQTPWKTDNNVEFMIHDFGGESAYTMIYPLFADAKAMVMLVYDHSTYSNETHRNSIGKWLDFFNMFMPGVVVKLVGAHLDKYEEYAILEDEEEDENGNITREVTTPGRTPSGRSSRSTRRSALSATSGRSVRSSVLSIKDDDGDITESPAHTVTPHSAASSRISQSKITEELVKSNIEKQTQRHSDKLQAQLDDLNEQVQTASSEKKSANCIKHLQTQKKKLELMIKHPLRIMPEINLVSNHEGLYGANSLIESLELMVIDKTLFPDAQRSMPDKWNQLRATLKQHKEYYLPWNVVEDCGDLHGVRDTELSECLQYLHGTGEILWFHDSPNLSKIVFHKPRVLVDLLASIFRHDLDTFLNFETNKVFMSKGMFGEEAFANAKELFLRNGQISRPLMNCFWFYEELQNDKFNKLLDLVPLLDVCYSIPEPVIPNGKLYSYPIVVLPWYNCDDAGPDFPDHWNNALVNITNPKTDTVSYSLPLGIPDGLFDKLICILQTHVTSRIDWNDTILATTETQVFRISLRREKVKVQSATSSQETEIDSPACKANIDLTIVSQELGNTTQNLSLMKELSREITDLLSRTPGLLWTLSAPESLWNSQHLSYAIKTVQFDE